MHQHVRLENGRARAAQIYPEKFSRAICAGLQKQINLDIDGQFFTMVIDGDCDIGSKELMDVSRHIATQYRTVVEDHSIELEAAWDDVPGAALNPKEVKRARSEEMEYVHQMESYEKVPVEECWRITGRSPISTRWIDINKGGASSRDSRSRFVAREINIHKREDLFAATQPSRP